MFTLTAGSYESPTLSELLNKIIKCYKTLQLASNCWVNKAVQPEST